MSEVRRGLRDRLEKTFRGQLTTAGQVLNTFEAEIPAGTSNEKLISGSYWWPHNRAIRPFDRIQCSLEDGSRIVLLRCMGKDEHAESLVMVVVDEQLFPTPEAPDGYRYEFVNRSIGWRIMYVDRDSAVRSHFATALEAHTWLRGDIVTNEAQAPAGSAESPAAGAQADGVGKKTTATKSKAPADA